MTKLITLFFCIILATTACTTGKADTTPSPSPVTTGSSSSDICQPAGSYQTIQFMSCEVAGKLCIVSVVNGSVTGMSCQ